jgi:two-component system response regulator MprA
VLDASKDVHPDLFLIDIVLPAMTGIELAAALRERGYDHTPIIGMSASRLMRQLAGLSGLFSTIIVKPFELANLRSLIRCYLGDTVTPHAVR